MNFWRFLLAGALLSFAVGLAHANAPLVRQDTQAGGTGNASVEVESLAALDLRIQDLQNQMARAMEEVERVNRERAELLARLDDLDSRIVLARQSIDSQRQQLAQLQANLAAGAAQGGQPEAEQAGVAEGSAADSGTAAPVLNPVLNPVVIGIGLALLVLAVLALRVLRRGRDERGEEQLPAAADTTDFDSPAADPGAEAAPESNTASAREDGAEEFDGETFRIEPGRIEPGRIEPGMESAAAAMTGEAGQEQEQEREQEMTSSDDPDPPPGEDGYGGDDEYVIDLDNGDSEEIAERLNLAYSFHRMGDTDQARRILEQVIRMGSEAQVAEAKRLLAIIHNLD